jgi:hypothetical protein
MPQAGCTSRQDFAFQLFGVTYKRQSMSTRSSTGGEDQKFPNIIIIVIVIILMSNYRELCLGKS